MAKRSKLAKALVSAARRSKLKPATPQQRILAARKKRQRERDAEARTLTAAGLSPTFAAKLQAAAKAAETDPEARALIEKARLAKRIDVAKREHGVGKSAPTRFMGATVPEYEAAVDSPVKIPPRLTDVRKPAEQPKKGKRK